jgi:hypothetical protein
MCHVNLLVRAQGRSARKSVILHLYSKRCFLHFSAWLFSFPRLLWRRNSRWLTCGSARHKSHSGGADKTDSRKQLANQDSTNFYSSHHWCTLTNAHNGCQMRWVDYVVRRRLFFASRLIPHNSTEGMFGCKADCYLPDCTFSSICQPFRFSFCVAVGLCHFVHRAASASFALIRVLRLLDRDGSPPPHVRVQPGERGGHNFKDLTH